jgi:hypothetical protein
MSGIMIRYIARHLASSEAALSLGQATGSFTKRVKL